MNETASDHLRHGFTLGRWHVEPAAGRIESLGEGETESLTLEPKVMDLLVLLAGAPPGTVFSREALFDRLWAGMTVGDDTLARTVFKLRKALGDDPRVPTYLETIPRRGYRLIAPVAPAPLPTPDPAPARNRSGRPFIPGRAKALALPLAAAACLALVAVTALLVLRPAGPADGPGPQDTAQADRTRQLMARADHYYMRFTRTDNEAAIMLYERLIAENPADSAAQAGLANALVQRAVRWQDRPAASLGEAVTSGLTETPSAKALLARAGALAERAVRLSPDDAGALKALGFVQSAQGDFPAAIATYEKAIALDPDAWAPLINLGELHMVEGDMAAAIARYEEAYDVMGRLYEKEPERVGAWHAPLGVLIGDKYAELGAPQEAEIWYRRVLALAPLDEAATARLAGILLAGGDAAQAHRLCTTLAERTASATPCPVGPAQPD